MSEHRAKVTLVYPDVLEGASWGGYYYSGVGALSAVLRRDGHEVSLLHIKRPVARSEFLSLLSDQLSPDLANVLGFSVTSNMLPFAAEWAKWSAGLDAFTIFGGVHPTLAPEKTLILEGVDAVCVGEGDSALPELATALAAGRPPGGISNIWTKTGAGITRTPVRPLVGDLDTLPYPDRGIFDYPSLYHERQGQATMMVSRGCPYNCSYCCNHALKELYQGLGRYVRFRSVAGVIGELKQVLAAYPFVRGFVFDDDILPLNRRWFEEFAREYRDEIRLPFACNLRPDLAKEDTVHLLKEAGCNEVRFGVESGDDRIRNAVMNRKLSRQDILDAFAACKREGMRAYAFNMVGLPHESVHDMLDTVRLNAEIGADTSRVTIFYPYEQTKLYETSKELGLLTGRVVTDYAKDSILDIGRTKRTQVLFIRRYFGILVRGYRALSGLPAPGGRLATGIVDGILSSKLAAYTVLPVGVHLYERLRANPRLDALSMRLKKKYFD